MPRPITSQCFDAASPSWFALQVSGNRLTRISDALTDLGIEQYAPTYRVAVQWGERERETDRLLFAGYIFVRLEDLETFKRVLDITGVQRALPTNLGPIPIPDEEIEALKKALSTELPAAPCAYVAGDPVKVVSGPLAGASGTIEKGSNSAVVIAVGMLGRGVRITVNPADLEKL